MKVNYKKIIHVKPKPITSRVPVHVSVIFY